LFEKHFSNTGLCLTNSCARIFTILTNHLEAHYKQQQQQQPPHNPSKFFNYYAQMRRDIFEFLLRIRSGPNNRVVLLSRSDRRKHSQAKYLLLGLGKDRGYSKRISCVVLLFIRTVL
jgi:hypothetical protein